MIILSYRQRLLLHNIIDAKLTELDHIDTSLSIDCIKLRAFRDALLDCKAVEFIKKDDDNVQ